MSTTPTPYTQAGHIEDLRDYLRRIEKRSGSSEIVHMCQAGLSIQAPKEWKYLLCFIYPHPHNGSFCHADGTITAPRPMDEDGLNECRAWLVKKFGLHSAHDIAFTSIFLLS